jgi:outer membrane scaffolding protein for murein synthesis (MipA/OmpV family)
MGSMRRLTLLSALAAAPVLLPAPAHAQFWVNEQGWIVTVSGNAIVSPSYVGASNYSFGAWPSISLRKAQDPAKFTAADDGISLALFSGSIWAVGLVGRYQSGRSDSDDRRLTGLREVDWSIQPGVFGEIWPIENTLRLRAELRFGIGGFSGPVGNISADFVQRWNQFTFYTGPRLAIGGSGWTDAYFTVTPAESVVNGLMAPYQASPGLSSIGWAAAVRYAYDQNWSGTVHLGYDRLVGSAADSPVTKVAGSANQFNVRASISYAFFWGGLR